VLLLAVLLAAGFGTLRARTDGRFRGTSTSAEEAAQPARGVRSVEEGAQRPSRDPDASVLAGTPYADQLGDRATLLQFSSAFCAPCRATRRTLEEVGSVVPGVAHVEVDAESHLDLVRRLGILRTPTTLVLDPAGREVARAAGAPTKHQVLSALSSVE